MDKGLLMHPLTKRQLEAFLKDPSHALLIEGPVGAGKTFLARYTASSLLALDRSKLLEHPYYLEVSKPEDKQTIPIESIREVNKFLSLKVPGKQPIRRVVLIIDAHLMTADAQSTLLKSLEEPPADTVFILSANIEQPLLPTVKSRCTLIRLNPVTLGMAREFFNDEDQANVEYAWRLSGGQPGLLESLVKDADNPLKSGVEQAKKILSQPRYERLLELDALSRDKAEFNLTLEALIKVIQALYKSAAKNGKPTKKLLASARMVMDAQTALNQNGLARLIAIHLALNLPI